MTIYLDSNVVIYFVEGDPVWEPKVKQRMLRAASNADMLAVSDAVRFECLVIPIRTANSRRLADYARYFGAQSLHFLPITTAVWDRAVQIRAAHGFGPLDSIHLAAAVEHGCGLLLTADARLAKFPDISVEVIS
jgi:uncharacterized protein